MAKTINGASHSHMWLVGMAGIAAGLILMVYVPSLKVVSDALLLFAGFHLVGLIVILTSLNMITGGKLRRLFPFHAKAADTQTLDFGWTPSWIWGPLVAALVSLAAAVAVEVALPGWWSLSLLLALLAASFFAGHLIASSSSDPNYAPLPMVDWLSGEHDLVLDGGCGAGRTTIAASRILRHGKIVALDRFDADYIENGGQCLLEKNLNIAGIADRVEIKPGDLTDLPFPDQTFDAAISAHAIDHLGSKKENGLAEMCRVLKPGGKLMLVLWVPSWSMFAVANLLSLSLTGKSAWRRMVNRVGFETREEGSFNGVWYLLLQRPATEG